MRKYKTVVIDIKKILHRGAILGLAALSTAAAIFLSAGDFSRDNKIRESILESNVPATRISDSETPLQVRAGRLLSEVSSLVLGFVPSNDISVIGASVPAVAAITGNGVISVSEFESNAKEQYNIKNDEPEVEFEQPDIPKENQAVIKEIDAAQKTSQGLPVAIGNETSYGINISEMLSSKPDIDMSVSGPKILITHTHATESYAPKGAKIYDITASDRNEDKTKNVVAVGRKMKDVFEKNGIETIHDEILHDVPSFNGSYAHSLNTVTEYMKKYPSVQIVFDIHRDSIVYSDKTKAKPVTMIDGKKAAQLMFVVGTDANGLYNPNWRSNMKAALHFQKEITGQYPKLMRHINLRKERFNGHTSGASMIIEVGASGNSLDEAILSAELAAECIAKFLKSI